MAEIKKFAVTVCRNPRRFDPGSFQSGCFGLGRFGQFLGWDDSALLGESFRPCVVSALGRFGPISRGIEEVWVRIVVGCVGG